jgi:hypothetical protein
VLITCKIFILKVTVHSAIGSTNSDNTEQLGKKVATDIKNQAINKTEGFVNNKDRYKAC